MRYEDEIGGVNTTVIGGDGVENGVENEGDEGGNDIVVNTLSRSGVCNTMLKIEIAKH